MVLSHIIHGGGTDNLSIEYNKIVKRNQTIRKEQKFIIKMKTSNRWFWHLFSDLSAYLKPSNVEIGSDSKIKRNNVVFIYVESLMQNIYARYIT